MRQARKVPVAATASSSPPARVEKRASVVAARTSRPASARSDTTSPTRPPSHVAPASRWRTSAATSRGEGEKARVCPTRDGPTSASTAPPASSQPRVRRGGAVRARPGRDAQPDQHQQGAQQLVADQSGVERRHDVRELEPLAVDRCDGDLQDDAGGAGPGGVPQQPAQPGTRLGAGPGAGEDQGEEERQTRREQQPDVGDDRDDVADDGHRGRGALWLGRRRHRRARVRRPRRSARPRWGGRRRRGRSTTRRRCRRRGRPRR